VILRLVRLYAGLDCTLGQLHIEGRTFDTIERPWIPDAVGRGGRKGVSCVPPGVYALERHNTEAHPKSFALSNRDLDVVHEDSQIPPELRLHLRTAVLIHAANFAHELRGCIAPGMGRRAQGSQWMVTNSRQAVRRLRELVPWTAGHSLEIRYGEGVHIPSAREGV
jgi:hypothetical protein